MTPPYDPYTDPDRLEDAVGRLTDPLNDPLPNQQGRTSPDAGVGGTPPDQNGAGDGGTGSPWFRPHHQTSAHNGYSGSYSQPDTYGQQDAYSQPDAYGQQPREPYAPQQPYGADGYQTHTPHLDVDEYETYGRGSQREGAAEPQLLDEPRQLAPDNETVALRQAKEARPARPSGRSRSADEAEESGEPGAVVTGGRAARRKAAAASAAGSTATGGTAAGGRAARRKAAAQAAKSGKGGFGVMASRAIGELFITTGVLLLLFVTYQLWWTNVQANQHANGEANNLERAFEDSDGKKPEKFEAGEGFAIMYIPKLDVRVPVAEGIEKGGVLDRGMAGHYDRKSGLETAMPWDKKGNFAVAGHRNTHGEPFRYINKLDPDDEIIVETQSTYYTYKVASRLASTSPSNTDVINPVPKQSGFTEPGRYLTLTTCTPEFSSKYRLIVWGTMVDERPRSDGKPEALGG